MHVQCMNLKSRSISCSADRQDQTYGKQGRAAADDDGNYVLMLIKVIPKIDRNSCSKLYLNLLHRHLKNAKKWSSLIFCYQAHTAARIDSE